MLETMECIPQWKEINGLCRLCLAENRTLQDIFLYNPDSHQHSLSLIDKISYGTSVKITEGDTLPTKICSECCEQVDTIYKFKKNCLAADSLLRIHVKHKLQNKESQAQVEVIDSERSKEAPSTSGTSAELVYDHVTPREKLDFDPELLKVEIIEEEEGIHDKNGSSSSEGEAESCFGEEDTNLFRSRKNKKMSLKSAKYTCKLCGKSFCNKYSLRRHSWSHSKKTLSCTHCNKTFINQESWLRHERMHQSGNRYQCHLCDKSYVSSSSHAAHIRKHTGERPYKCSECEETFYLITSYERHVAKHRDVKDYKCEICNADFWVADDLRAHVNRMH